MKKLLQIVRSILEIFGKEWFKEDAHCHIFEKYHYPENMIPIIPAWIEKRIKDSPYIRFFLRIINPFKSNTQLDFDANFLRVGDMGYNAQFRKYKEQMKKYFSEIKSVTLLTVDFEYMGAGKCEKGLEDQLEKAIFIKNLSPKGEVKVYMGIDPRRPDLLKLINKYQNDIDGLKLYLYNGFFPYDERLSIVYEIAEVMNFEVVFHCSNTNINYYRGKNIEQELKNSKFPLLKNRKGNKELSTNFCNPKGIRLVAQQFPSVKFRIAHFGGDEMIAEYVKLSKKVHWSKKDREIELYNYTAEIIDCLIYEQNITTDIAYICNNKESMQFIDYITELHPDIRPKIKFGLDWSMNETTGGIEQSAKILL
jgi:predicted TIM-barrel fold metal-dependent hydrolase